MHSRRNLPDDKRVVVTGVGMVSPLGTGRNEFSEKLFAGASGIRAVSAFDTSGFPSHLGAEVTNFSPRDHISLKNLRRMDRTSLLAAASSRMALTDAGVVVSEENRDRIGIILGTAFAATDVTAQVADALLGQGPSSVNPILVPNTVMNAPAGHTSIELGFRGVNTTVTHFAVSAETAIAYAVSEIRRGAADVLLAGGVDILSKFYYEVLTRFRGLSPQDGRSEGARPFDDARNGYVAGEGCGMMCLESLASARDRGAKVYCEILGTALGSGPAAPTQWPVKTDGITRTLKRALGDAGIEADQIDAVMAAANGSDVLDRTEADAYTEFFRRARQSPAVTSIKGAIGESFSGGGLRACALALSLDEKMLPPTVGLENPIASLNFVLSNQRAPAVDCALLAGISFGGTFAYLVFRTSES